MAIKIPRDEQGARLKAARTAAGFRSAAAAAAAFGWPESTYRAHEAGTRTIGQDDAERYAMRFQQRGVDTGALNILFGDERDLNPRVTQEVYPIGETEPIMRRLGAHTLPVLGITMGGETDDPDRPADFWMNGDVVNYVARPRSLENAKDAFALYVDGTSMAPRYRAKDMVVVQKTAPTSGDDVVIELKPKSEADEGGNPSFLKEFVRRAGGSIIVKQYNPEREITFDLKEIKNLFRVIPMRELMA